MTDVVVDFYLVLLHMLLYTLEVVPIVLTGGQGKPLLNPQLSSNDRQVRMDTARYINPLYLDSLMCICYLTLTDQA